MAQRRTQRRARADAPSFQSAMALYFSLLAVSLVLLLAAQAMPLGAGAELVATLVVALWSATAFRSLRPLLSSSPAPAWYALALGLGTLSFFLADAVVRALTSLGVEGFTYADSLLAEGYGWFTVVLSIVVQPALCEEIAFRGIVQDSMQRLLSRNEALVVSALMFSILHLSIPSMPHLFLLGLGLGWLRLATGSLYPAMLMHAAHNSLVLVSERWDSFPPW